MAEDSSLNSDGSRVPKLIGDCIIIIDHDMTSAASLTSMLDFSYKVISVDVASEALTMIEKQKKDIALVIANIEMPHIDSQSFLDALLHKNIPLILINPEITTKKRSDLLTNAACFVLNKPISKNDIENMWQHVLFKKSPAELNKIKLAEIHNNQIEAFRENLKRQTVSQASLLGRRSFNETFKISETSQKRRNIGNAEWKTKPTCPIEIENKRGEKTNMENNIGKDKIVWNYERQTKFIDAVARFGEEKSHPEAILKSINDPNLTLRQVASHLQKYKALAEEINETLRINEAISFKKPIAERPENMLKFHLGGKWDLTNHPFLGNVTNKSFINVKYVPSAISNNPSDNIPSTNNANNHIGMVSTALSSDNLPVLSASPSQTGAFNTNAFQMESTRISIPQVDPNPFHPPSSVLETDTNQMNLDLTSPSQIGAFNTNAFQMDSTRISIPHVDPNPFHPPSSVLETSTNQMNLDLTSLPESLVPLPELHTMEENFNFLPQPTVNPFQTQMNLVPCETNDVPYELESLDFPIEDLLSLDTDLNGMDMRLGNNGSLERGSTSQQPNMMQSWENHNIEVVNQRENIDGENHFDNDRDCVDAWEWGDDVDAWEWGDDD